MHKTKTLMDTTSNRRVYKRAYKRYVCEKTGKCDRCGWHSGENSGLRRNGSRKK